MKESTLYCLVPPELSNLREVIARDLAGSTPVEVLVERRRSERRTGKERRRQPRDSSPEGIERRLAHGLEGRRFAERRAPLVPAAVPPPLPPETLPYAEHLSFVERDAPERERDLTRLRSLALGWRARSSEVSQQARASMGRARREGLHALSAALAVRDRYTWEHSEAAVWLAVECAEEMGLSDEAVAEAHAVALLHDIGKIGVPDAVLRKAGALSEEEWAVMRQHPVIGAQLIDSIDTLSHLAPAIRAEHERWDGAGYPDGLEGEQIPLTSRLVFVCDAYQAMISERPYREPLSLEAARRELEANLGTQFWPDAAIVLLDVLDRGGPRERTRVAFHGWPPGR